jgi:adenylate cyclase
MKRFGKLALSVPGIIAVALIFILQLADASALRQAGLLLFDSYQRAAPREPIAAPVRVIDIDDESIAKIGQWPWPRDEIAKMNDLLAAAGASTVAYDIVFSENDRTSPNRVISRLGDKIPAQLADSISLPDNDEILAQSFSDSAVVTGYFLDYSELPSIMCQGSPAVSRVVCFSVLNKG